MNQKNITTAAIIAIFLIGSIFILNKSEKSFTEDNSPTPEIKLSSSPSAVIDYNTPDNCRTIINGEVYDLTDWIAQHPGGSQAIIALCGENGTESFNRMHGDSEHALERLESFKVTE